MFGFTIRGRDRYERAMLASAKPAPANQLYRFWDLIWAWTSRTVRGRYQQSMLGWLWAVVQPAATVVIFSIIFTYFVPIDTGDIPYPVFSYVAVLPWTFLAAALPDMSNSLVYNISLVTKIYFPREALPIAAMFARLLDFGIGVGLLLVLMLYYHMPLASNTLFMFPVILAIQITLVLGLGLACAALNVFVRDVQPLLTLGIQLWFYASPIIYPIKLIPQEWRSFYFLNPMAGILEAYRDVVLYGRLPGIYLLFSALVSGVIFCLGYWFFKRVEYRFADYV